MGDLSALERERHEWQVEKSRIRPLEWIVPDQERVCFLPEDEARCDCSISSRRDEEAEENAIKHSHFSYDDPSCLNKVHDRK